MTTSLKHVRHVSSLLQQEYLLILGNLKASPTLQQAQTEAILRLLNLNKPIDTPSDTSPASTTSKSGPQLKIPPATGPPVWKVLILDQRTKDVLATVLRVQDLRDVGVTLHV